MAENVGSVIVHQRGEGREIDLGNFSMTVKADAERTAGSLSVLEADEPPGFGPPIHIHHDAAEAFYVIAGEYLMFVGDQEFRCPEGAFVYIPAGVRHGFRVGNVASRKLNIYVPAAMLGYFDELSSAISRDEGDTDVLEAIAQRYAMEVVGPVPESYL